MKTKFNIKEMSDDFLVWVVGRNFSNDYDWGDIILEWYLEYPNKSPYLSKDTPKEDYLKHLSVVLLMFLGSILFIWIVTYIAQIILGV